MAISKVIYKSSSSAQGVTWIDATPATAAAADITSPKTAMLANGVVTQGTGSGGITPSGNINITQAGQTNVTNYATATVPAAEANGSVSGGFVTASGVRKFRVTGTGYAESAGWIDEGEIQPVSQYDYDVVPANTVITPSASSQTVGGEEYMMEGAVTIAAVPYAEATGTVNGIFVNVSGVRKFRITGASYAEVGGWVDGDATVGAEATRDYDIVPANTTITPSTSAQTIGGANYMMEGPVTVSAMPSGTAGTPSATKGTVSNHSVSVTPSVTNSTGYITGGTKTGTAVTVQASELVSGSETKTANGTYNVTNLASLVVAVPIVTYYTGSSAPSAALGSNGDIYLQTGS